MLVLKYKRFFIICLIFLTGLGIGSRAFLNAEDTLLLSMSTGPPFATEDHQGFLDLLIAEVFQRIGYEAEIVIYEASARALANANNGLDAGVAFRIKGLEREFQNLVRIPEPVWINHFVAFSIGLDFVSDSWESLNPYRVGHILGWKIFERNLPPDIQREAVINAMQLFTILGKERIDVALYERWQGISAAMELGLNIKVHEPPLAKSEMFIYLHKNYAHLAEPAAAVLVEMKQDGSYQEIVDRTLTSFLAPN